MQFTLKNVLYKLLYSAVLCSMQAVSHAQKVLAFRTVNGIVEAENIVYGNAVDALGRG